MATAFVGRRRELDTLSQASVEAAVRIEAPYHAGDWLLTLTLLDERIGWFDEFEKPSGNSRVVSVRTAPSPPRQPEPVRWSPLLHRLRRRRARRSAAVAPS